MRVLCLNIDEQQFHLVEAEQRGTSVSILRAQSSRTRMKYGTALLHSLPFDYTQAKDFVRECAAFLYSEPVFTSRLLLTLPQAVPYVYSLPVDPHCEASPVDSQIRWACQVLFPEGDGLPCEILSHPLEGQHKPRMINVALPGTTLQFLRETFTHLEFSVEGIEPDHFIMQNRALEIMSELSSGPTAVLGLFANSCAISLLLDGKLSQFAHRAVTYRKSYLVQILEFLRDILADSEAGVHTLAVHGSGARQELMDALASRIRIPVRSISSLGSITPISPSLGTRLRHLDSPYEPAICHILDYTRCESQAD